MKTDRGQEIEFWTPRHRASRSKPWELRWRVDDVTKSKSFKTKELARNRERALHRAAKEGERFSLVTGEPVSWQRSSETVYEHARAYMRHTWARTSSGNTRRNRVENVGRLVLAGLDDKGIRKDPAPAPMARVRRALQNYALSFDIVPGSAPVRERVRERTPDKGSEEAACLAWVARHSRRVSDFSEVEPAQAVLDTACVRLDGNAASAQTSNRRRVVWKALLDHGVERGVLTLNPLKGIKSTRKRSSAAVNPRQVPDWDAAGRLLGAIETSSNPVDRFLHAFFALGYLTGTRPGETRAIRKTDIVWPEDMTSRGALPGWGLLVASGSRTEVQATYTADGRQGEERELKGREDGEVRTIPLPPEAVAVLRSHLNTYGTSPDGRLFWHASKFDPYDTLPGHVYRRTWQRARDAALTTAEHRRNLAPRTYDLRHGNASLLIGEGVPPAEIARRLGHSIDVLLATYAHWLNEQEEYSNKLLDQAFRRRGPLTGQSIQKPANVARLRSSAA